MIKCKNFKSYLKGSLQGFADIAWEEAGIEINGISLFMKNGKRWISFPGKEYKTQDGETKYRPYIFFTDKEKLDAFSEKVKKAIDEWCAGQNDSAFKDEGVPF